MGDFLKSIIDVGKYILTRPRAERNRHIMCIVLFVFFTGGCVYVYEKLTNRWQLSRLERSARILQIVAQTPSASTNNFVEITDAITAQIANIVRTERDEPSKSVFFPVNIFESSVLNDKVGYSHKQRFLLGLLPWGIFALLFTLTGVFARDNKMKYAVVACVFMGAIISLVCMFLPDFGFPWMHWGLYPLISVLALIKFTSKSKSS